MCMCSTAFSLFAPDRNYSSRNYSTSKRSERDLERRSAGGRSAPFLKSEPCKFSPELVVGIRTHPGALATGFRSDRTPPIGRAVLGPDPSPLYPCAPNPETQAPGHLFPASQMRGWHFFGVPRSSAQTQTASCLLGGAEGSGRVRAASTRPSRARAAAPRKARAACSAL